MMMRRIIFSLLLAFSVNSYAENSGQIIETFTPLEVSQLFDKDRTIGVEGLIDLIAKEEKISICVEDYIKKQSKTYAKIAQNNLYDLIHNFDKITSRIYGKKPPVADISYEEKIEALAKVQCEAYYTIGVLK
jgi:hypothetical protein